MLNDERRSVRIMLKNHHQSVSIAGLCIVVTSGVACAAERFEIDYARDIRPILSGRCFKCHGPDPETREAGLRLDDPDAAIVELESGERAVVPGDLAASGLIERVQSDEEFLKMPPPDADPAGLSEQEIETLRQWVRQGAVYSRHWSFASPTEAPVPEVSEPVWCRNGIDRFILAGLERVQLPPSREADQEALIRRVTLDLTGLPPTLEEVDAFLSDPAPDAYERLVDRLLASSAYGERWGRLWLDLARYADSAGYADDPFRVIWKYRDWVIDAVNSGMAFDQFTIEQLAGDLLSNPTDEQLIATAFHRNTMTNSEGGTDDEEFRSAAIVDRVTTTMQVWMGLTMVCAQCHNHKYDPILQSEFYRVYDIFNQTEDADRRDESPTLLLYLPDQIEQRKHIQQQIRETKEELARLSEMSPVSSEARVPRGAIAARFVRIELPGSQRWLSLAEVEVLAGDTNLAHQGRARQSSTDYGGSALLAIDGNTDGHFFNAMSTTHTAQEDDPWWEVDLGDPYVIKRVVIWNRNDSAEIGDRLDGCRVVLLDERRQALWVKRIAKTSPRENSVDAPKSAAEFSEEDRAALAAYASAQSPEIARAEARLADLEKRLQAIKPVPTPILRELSEDKRRSTHIQIRGNFLDLGEQVHAGVPEAFHPIDDAQPDRLSFSKWLIDEANPLTARVIANRYWEALFGIGLVETSEDFGLQGELPTHPELLDWLAIQLMSGGWDTKAFVRLIVTSATYRQDSAVSPELAARDPKNRLLARGPRFRLSAEMIRDQALAIGGLLSRKMHGPAVQPLRPKLGLNAAFGASTDWETSAGEDRYRRGVYTRWQRSIPYPSMDAFDAPSREVCTIRRIRTNTPLQALVTLNDPVYIEAARGLAGRILTQGGETDEERMRFAFRLCTARQPNASELRVLLETFLEAQQRFGANLDEAQNLSAVNFSPTSVSIETQAAWTVVSNVLLNLDETLTRR